MSNIKKIALAVLLLNSNVLFAAESKDAPIKDVPVCTNQCKNSTWEFGVQALYLKPSYSGGYAYLNDTEVSPDVFKKNDTNTEWGWGYKLEAAYHFNSYNDLNLNWYHFKKSADGTFVFLTNPTADHYTNTPSWDAVNLELGQCTLLNPMSTIRLHGGVQYAQLKTTYDGHGIDPIAGPGEENFSMKFQGYGPRVGADVTYNWLNTGLAFAAKGAAAMIAGDSKYKTSETFGTTVKSSGSKFIVVPETEIKLETQYNYTMNRVNLNFNLGYLFVNYFNVLHDNFDGSETNVAFNGPYIGATIGFS